MYALLSTFIFLFNKYLVNVYFEPGSGLSGVNKILSLNSESLRNMNAVRKVL